VRSLKVMSSYAGENSIAPSCARKLTMVKFELKERIAEPHAYASGPPELQLLVKCG